MAQQTIILTSGTSWSVPYDCNLLDRVDCIGGGGSGGAGKATAGGSFNNATGGGGGGFAADVHMMCT